MRQLDTLLVHPDPTIRQQLRRALSSVDFLRVLGEAVHVEEAWHLLRALPYGVVFMGIELDHEQGTEGTAGYVSDEEGTSKSENGMDLARRILHQKVQNCQSHGAAVVFLAHDDAMTFEAFDLGATDYLIFPCSQERLERTLMRLKQFRSDFRLAPQQSFTASKQDCTPPNHTPHSATPSQDSAHEQEQTLQLPMDSHAQDDFTTALKKAWNAEAGPTSPELNKLSISVGGRTLLLPYEDITFIEADEDYNHVHTADNKFLTSYRLKNLEDRLRSHGFFRVHRKYLVNLQMVTELVSVASGNCLLRTAGRTRIELPISRRRLSELKHALGL